MTHKHHIYTSIHFQSVSVFFMKEKTVQADDTTENFMVLKNCVVFFYCHFGCVFVRSRSSNLESKKKQFGNWYKANRVGRK